MSCGLSAGDVEATILTTRPSLATERMVALIVVVDPPIVRVVDPTTAACELGMIVICRSATLTIVFGVEDAAECGGCVLAGGFVEQSQDESAASSDIM